MEFLLDPSYAYLNHGSFGACPREVFEAYQGFQRTLETQPVRFMQRELAERLATARATLSEFVGASPDEVVFVPNPTFAVNEIAKSLDLTAHEEVLMSDQEYGACQRVWQSLERKGALRLVEQPITVPVTSRANAADEFWQGVTPNTRVIFLSQITSPTALTLPVDEICRRAREANIVTVIDGAHAPGQIDVDLHELGADFYVATCHKWMCAPKGSAFLYARRDVQAMLEPLIVGWGWGDQRTVRRGSDFLDHHEWLGTWDPSAYLTVPVAIAFQQRNQWQDVRRRCHGLAVEVVERASQIDGLVRVHANEHFHQMALVEFVRGGDAVEIQNQLLQDFKVEVPLFSWKNRLMLRASLQAYNTQHDVDRLIEGLRSLTSTD